MKQLLAVLLLLIINQLHAQHNWKIVPGKITSPWAEKVNPAEPLPEYPRPQLVRNNWTNLNGIWEYSILPKTEHSIPAATPGTILVPFAVESALSGVGKTVGKDSVLWYKRTVSIKSTKNKNVLLHFGEDECQCTVFVNGK